MHYKYRLIVIVGLCVLYQCIFAQGKQIRLINPEQYDAQVKLVDEFLERFNNVEMNRLLLCDGMRYREDSIFRNLCDTLIRTIENNRIHLHFNDSDWYAVVKCQYEMTGEVDSLNMILSVEPRGEKLYKWVIADVQGDLFNLEHDTSNNEVFIMPHQHDMDFGALQRITSEMNKNISLYTKNTSRIDHFSVFAALVYTGQLKIQFVKDVFFVFMQVPGFRFTLRNFIRDSKNSGWLISDIVPMSCGQKEYLQTIIH